MGREIFPWISGSSRTVSVARLVSEVVALVTGVVAFVEEGVEAGLVVGDTVIEGVETETFSGEGAGVGELVLGDTADKEGSIARRATLRSEGKEPFMVSVSLKLEHVWSDYATLPGFFGPRPRYRLCGKPRQPW